MSTGKWCRFDTARQISHHYFEEPDLGGTLTFILKIDEKPNDDKNQDEDNDSRDNLFAERDEMDLLFSVDTPGTSTITAGEQIFAFRIQRRWQQERYNKYEFVRVDLRGKDFPVEANLLLGTRCSSKIEWNAACDVEFDLTRPLVGFPGDVAFQWYAKRDGQITLGLGHVILPPR